jgi:hypothetical protein
MKKSEITSSYPQTNHLVSTQNLMCEEIMSSGVGANDRCDGQNSWGFTRQGKIEHLQEGMRIDNSDKWVKKDSWDKRRIKFRREGDTIYTNEERLIKELEKPDDEIQFKVINETENKLIAFSFDDKNIVATSAASLFLDKSKGLLMYSNTQTSLFCGESLGNRTTLFSCKVTK